VVTDRQTFVMGFSVVDSEALGRVPEFVTVIVAVQMSPGARFETVSTVEEPVPEKLHEPPLLVEPGVAGLANPRVRVPALALPVTVIVEVKAAYPIPVRARRESAKRETTVVFVIMFFGQDYGLLI